MLGLTCSNCREAQTVPVSMLGKEHQCIKCGTVDKITLDPWEVLRIILGYVVCLIVSIAKGYIVGLITLVVFIGSYCAYVFLRQMRHIVKEDNKTLKDQAAKRLDDARRTFTPPNCPKCGEDKWELVETSPSYKSAIWKCDYCKKKLTVKANLNKESQRKDSRAIPKAVQTEVWRRDKGQCVECGSKKNIEYDHIIPWSKGGGNTARNIQLLCQNCNRSKSNKVPGSW